MKRFFTYLPLAAMVWSLSCSKITETGPTVVPFEKQTGPLPELNISVDSIQPTHTFRFDSIAQGGNFSIQFTPLTFGKIRIVELGRAIQVLMDTGNWKLDSSQYTICKNSVCRSGFMKIRNLSYKPTVPVDTIDTIPTGCIDLPTRTLYVPFSTSLSIENLFPTGKRGTIDSLKTDIYKVNKTSDSALTYIAIPIPETEKWAWDTIRYRGTSLSGQCYKAKIAVIIGDTNEAHARNDFMSIATGNALWNQTVLTDNDKGSNNQLGNYITRTDTSFDYGNYKVMNTPNGILTDTLVSGQQHYKYQRTNATALDDQFIYYFKNLANGRTTKAWVKITF